MHLNVNKSIESLKHKDLKLFSFFFFLSIVPVVKLKGF